MTRILFCGDPHGQFDAILRRIDRSQPDAVVLLGDLELNRALDDIFWSVLDRTELWFIYGNHDTDNSRYYDHLFHGALADHNLHGKVATVAGVRIAGLGGVFRKHIWYPPALPEYMTRPDLVQHCSPQQLWRDGVPRRHRSSIFPEDIVQLAAHQADILVTHEAPAEHPYGFSVLDRLATAMGVQRIIHGHHHDPYRYQRQPHINVGLQGFYELDTARLKLLTRKTVREEQPVSE